MPLWGRWDTWTARRAWRTVAFAALVLAATAWQLASAVLASVQLFGDLPTIEEVRTSHRHLFGAALVLATLPAAVGVLRARRRWLVVAAALVLAGAYVLVSPIDANSVSRPCKSQTCPDPPRIAGVLTSSWLGV